MTDGNDEGALANYAIGHTAGAVNAHAARSAARHAAFLVPYLKPGMRILDVGCGPGSITCDFAELIPDGHVTGVDLSPAVIETARSAARDRGVSNTIFEVGNVLKGLGYADESFDLVFCHQLLNHLSDPVAAIREMRRTCKATGIVALREGIMHVWYPDDPRLLEMDKVLAKVMRAGGAAMPGAGRHLPAWAKEAGFDPDMITLTVNGAPNVGKSTRQRMRGFFQDTFGEGSAVRAKAKLVGIEEDTILDFYSAAMAWCDNDEAFQVLVCGEVICRMGEKA